MLVLAGLAILGLATAQKPVILTEDNYKTMVEGRDRTPFLIKLYNPNCGHCQVFQKSWGPFAEMAAALYENVRIGEIDCSKNMKLCRGKPCRGFPCLVWSNGIDPENLQQEKVVQSAEGMMTLLDRLMDEPIALILKEGVVYPRLFTLSYDKISDVRVHRFWTGAIAANLSETKFALSRSRTERGLTVSLYGVPVISKSVFGENSVVSELIASYSDSLFHNFSARHKDMILEKTRPVILLILDNTSTIADYAAVARNMPEGLATAWAYEKDHDWAAFGITVPERLPVVFEFASGGTTLYPDVTREGGVLGWTSRVAEEPAITKDTTASSLAVALCVATGAACAVIVTVIALKYRLRWTERVQFDDLAAKLEAMPGGEIVLSDDDEVDVESC